jgi:hypothetical protein
LYTGGLSVYTARGTRVPNRASPDRPGGRASAPSEPNATARARRAWPPAPAPRAADRAQPGAPAPMSGDRPNSTRDERSASRGERARHTDQGSAHNAQIPSPTTCETTRAGRGSRSGSMLRLAATLAWLLMSGRDSELVRSLVPALLAEQNTAEPCAELLLFVLLQESGRAGCWLASAAARCTQRTIRSSASISTSSST